MEIDYYPFGMDMPNRSYSAGSQFRYGFNGKERDKDMHSLTAYDYGFRIYNPAIARFLSVDPLTQSYPWYTPYQFAGNKPIACIDLDGLEELPKYLDPTTYIPLLVSPCVESVLIGFYKRAEEMVSGVADIFSGKNKVELPKFEVGTPDVFNRGPYKGLDPSQLGARVLVAMFDGILSSYADLIVGAFNGDCEAAGGLFFEAVTFLSPSKFLEGANLAKGIRLFENVTVHADEAINLIKNGARDFKELDNAIVSSGKAIDVSKFHLPASNGKWGGTKGNSIWYSDLQEVNAITGGEGIPFVNGYADFSKWSVASFEVKGLTGQASDFRLVYKEMKKEFGFKTQSAAKKWLKNNNYTPHHAKGNEIQIIPTSLNKIPHSGGASELRKLK